jgi:hypothetical protein
MLSTQPGTPRGAPDSQTKHCIDGLHGNALAVGGLLVASARSALGAPSRLTRSVFWIAKRMISQPYCRYGWVLVMFLNGIRGLLAHASEGRLLLPLLKGEREVVLLLWRIAGAGLHG